MRFLYCKLQAKALLALHVYGRQYLHAGTAAVCEPALSLSRAHTVYLTLCPGEISFLWSDNFGDMFHLLRALNFSRSQKFPNVRQKPIFYVITYRQTFLLFSRESFFILAEK